MADYGVTPNGFVIKRMPEIMQEVVDDFKTRTGFELDTDPESVTGQFLAIICERFAVLWEQGQGSYWSKYPSTAEGASLDEAVRYTGVRRLPAMRTRVEVDILGVAGTVIPRGAVIRSTLSSGNYLAENDIELVEGVTTGWFYREQVGPDVPELNSLDRIITLVDGWQSVNNPRAAIPGRLRESDAELRGRYRYGVHRTGGAIGDAIFAELSEKVQGLISAQIYNNRSDVTDPDGRPPHSVEAVVYGGDDQAVADVLLRKVAFGVNFFGNVSMTSTDSQGFQHLVLFSRPVKKYIWFRLFVAKYNEEGFPGNAADLIRAAMVNSVGPNPPVGKDVIPQRFIGPIYGAVPGINNLVVQVAYTNGPNDDPPTSSDFKEEIIPIGIREIADYSIDRISVNIS